MRTFTEGRQYFTSKMSLLNTKLTDKPRGELRCFSSKKVNVVHEWGAVEHSACQPGRSFVVGAQQATQGVLRAAKPVRGACWAPQTRKRPAGRGGGRPRRPVECEKIGICSRRYACKSSDQNLYLGFEDEVDKHIFLVAIKKRNTNYRLRRKELRDKTCLLRCVRLALLRLFRKTVILP